MGSTHGAFRFLGMGHVPKCPKVLCAVTSRNAPSYGRELSSHGRQIGRMAKRCFFHLRQESATPCELAISAPIEASFTCQRRGAARRGDDVLVFAFASICGCSDDQGIGNCRIEID